MLEKFKLGLGTTFISMLIVFLVLIIIQYVIKLQTVIIDRLNNKTYKSKDTQFEETRTEVPEVKEEDNIVDDKEIVAAIMAALSAYTGESVSQLKIRSIKRVNNVSTWRNS